MKATCQHFCRTVLFNASALFLTDIFIVPPGWNELSITVTRSVHLSAMIVSPGLDDEDIG